MRIASRSPARLIRHDGLLAWNLLRGSFVTWRDRLTLAIMIPLALAYARNLVAGLPAENALHLCVFAALAVGFGVAGLLVRRMSFLRADSVLAEDALNRARSARYCAALLAVAALVIVLLVMLLKPSALLASLGAATLGAGLGGLVAVGAPQLPVPLQGGVMRSARAQLREPVKGLGLALVYGAALGLASLRLSGPPLLAVAGIAAALPCLALAAVDADSVRFMALSGYPVWRTCRHHGRSLLAFAALACPLAYLAAGTAGLALAGAVAAAFLLVMVLRILAYRIYRQRLADLLVSIALAELALILFAMPVLLPVVVIATLWWFWRRADQATWLIA